MNYREDNFYIGKVLKGNLPSYAILVEKHKSMAYTLALRISKNHEDAEEIAQDAFLKVFNSLGSFKQESKFTTWLFKIVYNTAISRLRKKQIESYSMEDNLVEETISIEADDGQKILQHKQRKKIISEAISALPLSSPECWPKNGSTGIELI